MLNKTIRKLIYRASWDTRRRNVDITQVLKPLLADKAILLDVGCGEFSLAKAVYPARVVGVDIVNKSYENSDNLSFVSGSVVALPFSDKSFPVVASVDMIEHLPADVRIQALRELFRVAKKAVVIAFPFGKNAYELDVEFKRRLKDKGKPEPEWLTEHLQNQYPELKTILTTVNEVAANGKNTVKTTVSYSENLGVTRALRKLATRSKFLYVFMNILAGMSPVVLQSDENNSYRVIIVTEVSERGDS